MAPPDQVEEAVSPDDSCEKKPKESQSICDDNSKTQSAPSKVVQTIKNGTVESTISDNENIMVKNNIETSTSLPDETTVLPDGADVNISSVAGLNSSATSTAVYVKSPTAADVQSPTAADVKSPTAADVKSPTAADVKSPGSTDKKDSNLSDEVCFSS